MSFSEGRSIIRSCIRYVESARRRGGERLGSARRANDLMGGPPMPEFVADGGQFVGDRDESRVGWVCGGFGAKLTHNETGIAVPVEKSRPHPRNSKSRPQQFRRLRGKLGDVAETGESASFQAR